MKEKSVRLFFFYELCANIHLQNYRCHVKNKSRHNWY
jgi:hypothetical protein